MSDAPERIWAEWSGGEIEGVEAFGYLEEQAFTTEYIRADLHQQALDAAREEGRRAGLEEALGLTKRTEILGGQKYDYVRCEEIRALIDKPADPVAEEDSFEALISEAMAEAERAMQRFPQPNYVISKVAEEAGEVVKADIHCAEGREKTSEVRSEMKQLIAMLYRLWVEGDGVHGLRALAQKEGE